MFGMSITLRASLVAALVLTSCGPAADRSAVTSSPTDVPPSAIASPTRSPESTRPVTATQQPLPLPTRVRWAVDVLPQAPDRPLLVLFADGYASGYQIVDAAGGLIFRVGIAGSGIFSADTCVSRASQGQEVTTWVGLDVGALESFTQRYRTYRAVAEGIPSGETSLELIDSGCRSEPTYITEAEAWDGLRRSLPADVPIARPTWLPPSIDREKVYVGRLGSTAASPRYGVIYRGTKGTITLGLGDYPDITGSGYGTRVRGVPATLTFASSLFTDPTTPSPRRVRWVEGAHVFTIDSMTYSGDDLLHIAWYLDPTGSPPPKIPFTRTARGACAATGGTPEETVRMLISRIGRGPADAIVDCFADAYVGEYGTGIGSMWAALPTASLDTIRRGGDVGGRAAVAASWTFASDPGGAWNQRQTMFFTLGPEDGRWRIHEGGTGAIAPPP